MSSVCIATVVSSDTYQYYVPMFAYCIKRAYPNYHVKVFIHGEYKENVAEFMKSLHLSGVDVIPNAFPDYPHRKYIYNILRWLIPDKHFDGYDYVFLTDVDFLFFWHSPTLKQNYVNIMNEIEQPCVLSRGPRCRPKRKEISKRGWKGRYTRMAGGKVFLRWPEWSKQTLKAREKYRRYMERDEHDYLDKHKMGSYREQDEVVLCRIARLSGLKTPKVVGKTCSGRGTGNLYRDIHLGDFAKDTRAYKYRKFDRRIKDDTCIGYHKLSKEEQWKKIVEFCSHSNTIRQALRRVDRYMKSRGYTPS